MARKVSCIHFHIWNSAWILSLTHSIPCVCVFVVVLGVVAIFFVFQLYSMCVCIHECVRFFIHSFLPKRLCFIVVVISRLFVYLFVLLALFFTHTTATFVVVAVCCWCCVVLFFCIKPTHKDCPLLLYIHITYICINAIQRIRLVNKNVNDNDLPQNIFYRRNEWTKSNRKKLN